MMDGVRTFFDGLSTVPRLDHPECLALAPDGSILAGTEHGALMRVTPDGSSIEQVSTIGGFLLGIACTDDGTVYACDMATSSIARTSFYDPSRVDRFSTGPVVPNGIAVDVHRGCLYVTDSYSSSRPGPGIWRFDLRSGVGAIWTDTPFWFANGICLAPDGRALYVVESLRQRIVRVEIAGDGSPGPMEVAAANLGPRPDGVLNGPAGGIIVCNYAPSRVTFVHPDGRTRIIAEDPTEETLCHPTNGVLADRGLLVANFGRWHISEIDLSVCVAQTAEQGL